MCECQIYLKLVGVFVAIHFEIPINIMINLNHLGFIMQPFYHLITL